jgi:hypothetical protein
MNTHLSVSAGEVVEISSESFPSRRFKETSFYDGAYE